MSALTKEQAKLWMEQKPINPITGRKLKETAAMYRKLDSMAHKILGIRPDSTVSTQATVGRCKNDWIKLTDAEGQEYGMKSLVPCPCGEWKFLNAVHDEYGDYYCTRCEYSVNLVYFCYYCKNSGSK